jgi:hypothetical protein
VSTSEHNGCLRCHGCLEEEHRKRKRHEWRSPSPWKKCCSLLSRRPDTHGRFVLSSDPNIFMLIFEKVGDPEIGPRRICQARSIDRQGPSIFSRACGLLAEVSFRIYRIEGGGKARLSASFRCIKQQSLENVNSRGSNSEYNDHSFFLKAYIISRDLAGSRTHQRNLYGALRQLP